MINGLRGTLRRAVSARYVNLSATTFRFLDEKKIGNKIRKTRDERERNEKHL